MELCETFLQCFCFCFFQITKMQKNELKTNLNTINFGVELKTAVSLRSLTFWRNLAGRGFSNPNISESSVELALAQIHLSLPCNPRWRWDLRSLGGLIVTSRTPCSSCCRSILTTCWLYILGWYTAAESLNCRQSDYSFEKDSAWRLCMVHFIFIYFLFFKSKYTLMCKGL